MIKNKYDLKRHIHYNPYTGEFTRISKNGFGPNPLGSVSGPKAKDGNIRIQGDWYRLARLAWMYMTGEWHSGNIFHADGDQSNYKWSNLKQSDGYQISWIKSRKRHQIYFREKYLGSYKTREECDKAIQDHCASRQKSGKKSMPLGAAE
jgi:hypothetical protein